MLRHDITKICEQYMKRENITEWNSYSSLHNWQDTSICHYAQQSKPPNMHSVCILAFPCMLFWVITIYSHYYCVAQNQLEEKGSVTSSFMFSRCKKTLEKIDQKCISGPYWPIESSVTFKRVLFYDAFDLSKVLGLPLSVASFFEVPVDYKLSSRWSSFASEETDWRFNNEALICIRHIKSPWKKNI